YGAIVGIGGAIEGNVKGAIRIAFTPAPVVFQNAYEGLKKGPIGMASDYAMSMQQKYGELEGSAQDYAVGANALTDITLMILPFKKTFNSPKVPVAEAPIVLTEEATINTSKTAGLNEVLAAKYAKSRPSHRQSTI